MNPIICVTEFSEHTVEAARAAAALAHCMQGNLILVHSVDERGQFPARLRPRLMNEDRPRLAQETERLRQLGLEFDPELLRGIPDDGIAQFAAKQGAQLVVVGCAPTCRIERWLLGCTAEELAESSPAPTLAVRSAAPFVEWAHGKRPLRIFVGTDLTANSDAALRWLREFCQFGSCEIIAGLIADPRAGAVRPRRHDGLRPVVWRAATPGVLERLLNERVTRVLGGGHVRVCVAAKTRSVEADLVTLASGSDSDLLVVGTHQWKGFTRWVHHSVSRGVLRRAAMNVLCVPENGVDWTMESSVGECRQATADDTPVQRETCG